MTPLPRTAVSLYVALALHALVLLAMALHPPSQDSSGAGQGLSVRGASLSVAQRRWVTGVPAESPRPSPAQPASTQPEPSRPIASTDGARRLARERASPGPTHPLPPAIAEPRSQAPAVAPQAAAAGGGGRDLYFARLRAHLAGFRRELRAGLPAARSHVRVAVTRDGWIEDLVLVTSSGIPELDAEALDLVRRAAPLPAPPGGRAVRLIVPVEIVAPGP